MEQRQQVQEKAQASGQLREGLQSEVTESLAAIGDSRSAAEFRLQKISLQKKLFTYWSHSGVACFIDVYTRFKILSVIYGIFLFNNIKII